MLTAPRARNQLLAALFVTCMAIPSLGISTSAQAATREAVSASSRVPRAVAAASAASRSLAFDIKTLRKCQVKHPRHCGALRKIVRRARRRLARRELVLFKLGRRQGRGLPTRSNPTPKSTRSEASQNSRSATKHDVLAIKSQVPTGSSSLSSDPPPTAPLPILGDKIIGTNDGAGWGPVAAQTIIGGHITWNRVEIGASTNTLAESLSDGFHVLAIVGNVDDSTPLSQVEPNSWAASVVSELQANPGITIAEAGNEMFLKGGVANPIQYGRLYLAAVNAMKAAGIHTPLLFNMFGDYPQGSWASPTSWSRDSTGGGWLHDAVTNVPGLAAAILANGASIHPYGGVGENAKDEYGTGAVPAEEAVTHTELGATPTFYITEFGYDLSKCGKIEGACSQEEQATKTRAAYKLFLADPHVAGIWIYQSHDDGTGQYGYMNNDNTTRPTFNVLTENAIQQGQ